ncbi:MAG: PIN domain nuclease [Chitinivibrionia bacterium]|nr:PIN domain nuclease [Chitinivibrionia bacterium]
MIFADTSVWIDYFNGKITPHTDALDNELFYNNVLIGDLVITEVLQGFKNDSDFETANFVLSNLEYCDMAGKEIAIKAAENFRNLRKMGITVRKTIDVIIGTFCIENGITLLHNDRDFDPMENCLGLSVYSV